MLATPHGLRNDELYDYSTRHRKTSLTSLPSFLLCIKLYRHTFATFLELSQKLSLLWRFSGRLRGNQKNLPFWVCAGLVDSHVCMKRCLGSEQGAIICISRDGLSDGTGGPLNFVGLLFSLDGWQSTKFSTWTRTCRVGVYAIVRSSIFLSERASES